MILSSRGIGRPAWSPLSLWAGGRLWQQGRGSFALSPLLITRAFHSCVIASSLRPSPWTIDPERTQELVETTSPSVTLWSSEYRCAPITTDSPNPTPWSIDPERTQEL